MRSLHFLISLCALASTARAKPLALTPLDANSLPEPCRAVATVPVTARIPGPALAATSFANRLAERQRRSVASAPDEAAAQSLELGLRPSLALYEK